MKQWVKHYLRRLDGGFRIYLEQCGILDALKHDFGDSADPIYKNSHLIHGFSGPPLNNAMENQAVLRILCDQLDPVWHQTAPPSFYKWKEAIGDTLRRSTREATALPPGISQPVTPSFGATSNASYVRSRPIPTAVLSGAP